MIPRTPVSRGASSNSAGRGAYNAGGGRGGEEGKGEKGKGNGGEGKGKEMHPQDKILATPLNKPKTLLTATHMKSKLATPKEFNFK